MKKNLPIQLATTCMIIGLIVVALWYAPAINATVEAKKQRHIALPVMQKIQNEKETVQIVSRVLYEVLTDITIVGVEASIDMASAEVMEREVNALWATFRGKNALHQNVNWMGEPKIYAHYHGFNNSVTKANLFIGYNSDALQLSSFEKSHKIPQVKYQVQRAIEQSELVQQWQSDIYPVSNVIERYSLDGNGDIVLIDFLHAK